MVASQNFSKSVILSVSDSVPEKDNDLLEGILPNKMTKKMNLMIMLIVLCQSEKETYPYMTP